MNDVQQIQRYFEYYCRRLPDPESLRVYAEHLANGTSLGTLHLAIANSDEARQMAAKLKVGERLAIPDIDAHYDQAEAAARSGAATRVESASAPPPPVVLSDEEIYVSSIYIALLGRRPDDSGMQGYLTAIRGGLPLDRVVHDIYFSSEARQLNGPCRAISRIATLQRLGKLGPLKRLCAHAVNGILAVETQRLWKRRIAP